MRPLSGIIVVYPQFAFWCHDRVLGPRSFTSSAPWRFCLPVHDDRVICLGAELHAVIVQVDEETGRATAIKRQTVS
jgi:hypothetical protein